MIPAGKHTISFSFDPQSLHTTEAVANGALIALAVIALLLIISAVIAEKRKRK